MSIVTSGTPYTSEKPASVGSSVSMPDILSTLWAHRRFLMTALVASIVISTLITTMLPTKYTAETELILDRASRYAATFDTPMSSLIVDSSTVASEIELIYSRELVQQVVESTELLTTDEYTNLVTDSSGQLSDFLRWAKSALPGDNSAHKKLVSPMAAAVDQFRENLHISRKGISNVIVVQFTSEDAGRSLEVVNTLADQYISNQLDLQQQQGKNATESLEEQTNILRQKMQASDIAIEEQRQELGIVTSDGVSKLEQKITSLNEQFIKVSAEHAALIGEFEQAKSLRENSAAIEKIPTVSNSPDIQKMRAREFELKDRISDLGTKYGQKHPLVVQTNAQLQQTRIGIRDEVNSLVNAIKENADAAFSLMQRLEEEMAILETERASANPARALLSELEAQALAYANRMDFLQKRIRESDQTNSLANRKPFAYVISKAEVPSVNSVKTLLLLLLPLLVFITSVAGIIVRMMLRNSANSKIPQLPEGVAYIGSLPKVSPLLKSPLRKLPVLAGNNSPDHPSHKQTLDNLLLACPQKASQVFIFTALEHEKDSRSVSLDIARASTRSGESTIWVDLNLRQSHPDRTSGNLLRAGVSSVMGGKISLEKAICRDDHSSLHILRADATTEEPSRLLGDDGLRGLLVKLRREYKVIIVNTPPVLDCPDASVVCPLAEMALLVTSLGELSRQANRRESALDRLRNGDGSLIGVIIRNLNTSIYTPAHFDYSASEHYFRRMASVANSGLTHPEASVNQISASPYVKDTVSNLVPNRKDLRFGERRVSRGETWLLQQAPDLFTLKLGSPKLLVSTNKKLLALITGLPIAHYVKKGEENPEKILLIGFFNSYKPAKELANQLSAVSRELDARVHSLSDIQQDIRQNKLVKTTA